MQQEGCSMNLPPQLLGPGLGTASLAPVMLPSRDLASAFCSLILPPPKYIYLDLLESCLRKGKVRALSLKGFREVAQGWWSKVSCHLWSLPVVCSPMTFFGGTVPC